MTKIVINKCYGGFGLSEKAYERLIELGMTTGDINDNDGKFDISISKDKEPLSNKYYAHNHHQIEFRKDKRVVKVVKELGLEANGGFANLKIVNIPKDVEITIEEYDGVEWIAEKHRTWS